MSQPKKPKIIYLTSVAGGMYCGSCMHDNTLARAMAGQGWDIQLVPTYTPIRTDEADVSVDRVFLGGINVFLQQKVPLLRYIPQVLDQFLDNPRLIRRVTSKAIDTDARTLGKLTCSMLRGTAGNQRKEMRRLISWLTAESPDVLIFSNILIGGCIPDIKRQLDVPIVVTLQGDDIFLDSLPLAYRNTCIDLIKSFTSDIDGFIVHTEFFRKYMSQYFGLDPDRIHVTPLGIDTTEFQSFLDIRPQNSAAVDERIPDSGEHAKRPLTIGYLARLSREKGLHLLVDAFISLRRRHPHKPLSLKVAGWLGPANQDYAHRQWDKLDRAGLASDFQFLGSVDRAGKLRFLSEIDLLSVPTEFLEPKGLYALEALAAGVPVVQPAHGAFPELIQQTGGGRLFRPLDADDLAEALFNLVDDSTLRLRLGQTGQRFVHQPRNSQSMAAAMANVISDVVA
jgi:glycosyltransferase involved in cell wall biosynthesis